MKRLTVIIVFDNLVEKRAVTAHLSNMGYEWTDGDDPLEVHVPNDGWGKLNALARLASDLRLHYE